MSLLYAVRASRNRLNPTAAAYINAVTDAGASVTATQRQAINTFIKTGISEGWGANIRRLYLPIWGLAAPNAIDLITTTSGTFVGGVTHGDGFVQGNGSTGYFNTGATQGACSISASSGYYFALLKQAATGSFRAMLGTSAGATMSMILTAPSTSQIQADHYGNTTGRLFSSSTTPNGIISFSRFGGDRTIWRRSSSSRTAIAGPTAGADVGSNGNANIFALASNNSVVSGGQSPVGLSNAQLGAVCLGVGVSNDDDSKITSAAKTLWETCTGLSLP